MKNVLVLLIILLAIACVNPSAKQLKDFHAEESNLNDSSSTGNYEGIKLDSVNKVSKPFLLNDILCYWDNYILNNGEIKIQLKNFQTKEVLIAEMIYTADSEIDYTQDTYFQKLAEDSFDDFNFDGYQDFYIHYRGSMAMTSSIGIFIYNATTKAFEDSDELSANSIDSIDRQARKLITSDFGRDFAVLKTHYFGRYGKLLYSEITTKSSRYIDTVGFPVEFTRYEKVINGKVVESKRDSVISVEN